jgi:hypothetical protein
MKKMNQSQLMELTQRIAGLMFKNLKMKMKETEERMLEDFMKELDAQTRAWYEEIVLTDVIGDALEEMQNIDVDAAFIDVQQRIGMPKHTYPVYRLFRL